jgi:hypothetical protein
MPPHTFTLHSHTFTHAPPHCHECHPACPILCTSLPPRCRRSCTAGAAAPRTDPPNRPTACAGQRIDTQALPALRRWSRHLVGCAPTDPQRAQGNGFTHRRCLPCVVGAGTWWAAQGSTSVQQAGRPHSAAQGSTSVQQAGRPHSAAQGSTSIQQAGRPHSAAQGSHSVRKGCTPPAATMCLAVGPSRPSPHTPTTMLINSVQCDNGTRDKKRMPLTVHVRRTARLVSFAHHPCAARPAGPHP